MYLIPVVALIYRNDDDDADETPESETENVCPSCFRQWILGLEN